uniref:Putative dehydrogenase n=1 Tax=Ornithodoros turicata TaxID=34597 RepID=A0A2R5LF43_9ACAR
MTGATGSSGDKFRGRKCFVLITGGSRGIGKTLAIEFAKNLAKDSVIVITGRSATNLQDTQFKISSTAEHIKVVGETCDHSTATYHDYEQLMSRTSRYVENPESTILVHNVGTLGDVSMYAASYDDPKMIGDYMYLNLTSVMLLTSAFLKQYGPNANVAKTIINVTTPLARKAVAGLGLYSGGKAAREMYLNVLAVENPAVKILHYYPGVVKTDMLAEIQTGVKEMRPAWEEFLTKAMDPEPTAGMLVDILRSGDFESGEYISYYDRACKVEQCGRSTTSTE